MIELGPSTHINSTIHGASIKGGIGVTKGRKLSFDSSKLFLSNIKHAIDFDFFILKAKMNWGKMSLSEYDGFERSLILLPFNSCGLAGGILDRECDTRRTHPLCIYVQRQYFCSWWCRPVKDCCVHLPS